MPRGRPVKSAIRQNVIEILSYLGKGYGYQISKIYNDIFPQVTQRSIYYQLQKGVKTQEFEIHKIETEKGDYSWGDSVEKIYYSLGIQANQKGEERVHKYLKGWKKQDLPKQEPKKKFNLFFGILRKK